MSRKEVPRAGLVKAALAGKISTGAGTKIHIDPGPCQHRSHARPHRARADKAEMHWITPAVDWSVGGTIARPRWIRQGRPS